jgi:hypothetical protein
LLFVQRLLRGHALQAEGLRRGLNKEERERMTVEEAFSREEEEKPG